MIKTFYTNDELQKIGFKSLGKNVLVSRLASVFSPELISIGDNSRIDDFCVLSGNITIGKYVHISTHCDLFGIFNIFLDDYSGISSKSIVYTSIDDFSGNFLVGAQVPKKYRNIKVGSVIICKYVQLGCNSVIFPGITLHEGAATGAFTLVKTDLPEWTISVGIPSKVIKKRSDKIIKLVSILKHDL